MPVHRAGRQTQRAAVAFGIEHGVHELARAENGVHRTDIQTLATDRWQTGSSITARWRGVCRPNAGLSGFGALRAAVRVRQWSRHRPADTG